MRKIALLTAAALVVSSVASIPAFAGDRLGVCKGQFAFCGASGATATGRTMIVKGKKFRESMAVCPVMTGPSVANLTLMKESCNTPDNTDKTVWSLFWYYDSVPQAPTWETLPAVNRTFVTTKEKNGGMSNMWSFPCVIEPQKVNGVTLAKCYGPLNESPWTNDRVKLGTSNVTQAIEGSPNPVGGPLQSDKN